MNIYTAARLHTDAESQLQEESVSRISRTAQQIPQVMRFEIR